ncbi:hypothetical protein EW145_g6208 [Phellinidium pouzarii]|uniref:Uncharacterized protein n=1 Tax=Phellinidium pouzarii TaxID=167371 RepID=A0A4S4KYH6_9AGAM|nr:hypothetical protein EW145_g6208 [Phellinidium pouzarii]
METTMICCLELSVGRLAETAVTKPIPSSLYDDSVEAPTNGLSLLSIMRKMYDSETLKPIMPYQPDALLSTRMKEALTDARAEEICKLAAQWHVNASLSPSELDTRVEEVFWLATLLMAATGKPGRKPRLDFFLMHIVTSALFIPSLVRALPDPSHRTCLLRVTVPIILLIVLVRGRPRIDCALVMSYTAVPRPPRAAATSKDEPVADTNPWLAIVDDSIHAQDAHIVKTIRTLFYAAQRYGETLPGGVPGAYDAEGNEALKGAGALDGTLFIRVAGVVMDTLGWVTHGQKEGNWDRSALGWDAAWDAPD